MAPRQNARSQHIAKSLLASMPAEGPTVVCPHHKTFRTSRPESYLGKFNVKVSDRNHEGWSGPLEGQTTTVMEVRKQTAPRSLLGGPRSALH